MPTTTALDIIKKALQKIGVGAEGENLSFEAANDGLDALNDYLSLLGVRGLLTTAQIQESFALSANISTYTIGPFVLAPNFITAKPITLCGGFIRDANGNDTGLDVISREEYNSFSTKTDSGTPDSVFYDPGATQQASQVGTFYFYPAPDSTIGYTAFLVSGKTFTRFVSLSSLITFPDFYNHMLIFNLAVILAPDYGKSIHPEVTHQAEESMRIIETINSANKNTVVDLGLPKMSRNGNILTGS